MKFTTSALAAGAAALTLVAAFPTGTVRVTDAAGADGFAFNTGDGVAFTDDEASVGRGSLEAGPIDNDTIGKFIAYVGEFEDAGWPAIPFDGFEGLAVDYLVEDAAFQQHVYLNVYWELPGDGGWYDCRYDYTPSSPATPGAWATLTTEAGVLGGAQHGGCTADPADLPDGAQVLFATVNVGQSNDTDNGVSTFLDNVRLTVDGATTTYDLEFGPSSRDDCRTSGWQSYAFRNQGQCVSWANGR